MFKFDAGQWLNPPKDYSADNEFIRIATEPDTDLWQNTYYDFVHTNAHAYLFSASEDFTFTVKASFSYRELFDQCGIILYLDDRNWAKASIERENENRGWLGSVVTNSGYSDWATTSLDGARTSMYYRLSRRGADFLFEQSLDGVQFRQMRIFHMHGFPETVSAGVYACSPGQSSFVAEFSELKGEKCLWLPHK